MVKFLHRHSLLFVLLIALVVRLAALGRTLWYDEAFAVLFSEKGLGPMLYGTLTPVNGGAADIHPLLYYMTLDGWMKLFGESPTVVRALSVVFSLATVGVIYLLGHDLFDRRTGLAAALITGVAPFAVQYGTEVRMYSLLGLLLSAATWCCVRGWREPAPILLASSLRRWWHRWGWWVGFGVLAALAMYTQQLAAFYLVALGGAPVLARRRRQIIGVLLGAGVALILYLPWLIQLPGQLAKVGAYYWTSAPNVPRLILSLYLFLVVGLDLPPMIAPLALVSAVILFVILVIQVIKALRRPRRVDRGAIALVFWLFAGPVLLMWSVSQVRPVYVERGLFPSALILYLALGWLFTRGGLPRPIMSLFAVIAGFMFLSGLVALVGWKNFPNSDYSGAQAWIVSEWQQGDRVAHQNKMSALSMLYVNRQLPQRFIIDVPGSWEDTLALPTQQALDILGDACIQSAAFGAKRLWFVNYGDLIRQSLAAGRSDVLAEFTWLNAHYSRRESRSFPGDLDVTLYDSPDAIARAAGTCPP